MSLWVEYKVAMTYKDPCFSFIRAQISRFNAGSGPEDLQASALQKQQRGIRNGDYMENKSQRTNETLQAICHSASKWYYTSRKEGEKRKALTLQVCASKFHSWLHRLHQLYLIL